MQSRTCKVYFLVWMHAIVWMHATVWMHAMQTSDDSSSGPDASTLAANVAGLGQANVASGGATQLNNALVKQVSQLTHPLQGAM